MYSEPLFPRGGILKKEKYEIETVKKKDIKYGARTDHLERKVRPSKKQRKAAKLKLNDEKEFNEFASKSADQLNKHTIIEGMLLLGVIQSINEMSLDVALPGKMQGKVPVTAISDPYSKLLEKVISQSDDNCNIKPLDQLFTKGQYIAVKVTSFRDNSKSFITLSVNPSDINAERHHSLLQKGLVIVGAVSGIEDHGYTIETNIKNVRAFLPIEKTKMKLDIGGLVYGCIDDLTRNATTSTVILKTNKDNDIGLLEIENEDPVLDYLLPGTIVPFTMTKILKNGLQGNIFNMFTSYVNENYLTDPLHRPSDYSIGLQFDSRILYVTPLTKHVALTLNFNKIQFEGDEGILPVGHIVENAVSLGLSSGAVLFKINKNSKGIVTIKSIKSKYKTNYDERTALLPYGKTTKHRLRIFRYNAFERVYICTDKEQLLNEPYFSINDLSIGDIVEAKIVKILKGNEKRIALKIGQIKGYMHNLDCSGSLVKSGMKMKVRVLSIDYNDKTALVTNRPEILKASNVLTRIDEARIDDVYTGLIVKESQALYLVRFFNGVKGVMFKNSVDDTENLQLRLKVGVVASFRISDIHGDRIVLKIANDIDSRKDLGTILSSKIECIHPTGAQITVKKYNLSGNIPINFFSDFSEIRGALIDSFKEGQKIKVVKIMDQIYSIRDVKYFSKNPPLTFKSVQKGDILKCNVKEQKNGIIEIICPLFDYTTPIKMHLSKILPTNIEKCDELILQQDTPIFVRVESKLLKPKTLIVSAKLEDVWNGSSDASIELLQTYFHEIDTIKLSLEAQKKAIASHYIGELVTGTVSERFDEHSVLVIALPNGVSALCRNIITKNFNLGDIFTGKIVWIDYIRQILDLVPNTKTMSCINASQVPKSELLSEKSRIKGHVILVRDDIIIVSIGNKGPLVYLSTRFHINDLKPTLISNLAQYGKCTIHLLKVIEGRLIGMFEDNYKQCQNFMRAYGSKHENVKNLTENKRKRINSENSEDLAITQKEGELMNKRLKKHVDSMFKNQLDGAVDILCNKNKQVHNKKKEMQNDKLGIEKAKQLKGNRVSLESITKNKTTSTFTKQHTKQTKTVNAKSLMIKMKTVGTKKLLSLNIAPTQHNGSKVSTVDNQSKNKISFWTSKDVPENNSDNEICSNKNETHNDNHKMISKNVEPSSVLDFDRLLTLNPDNGKLWIQYMQFHMKTFDIEKARGVGQRAIKVINYRNEKDKIKIWIELLRIEISHGTPDSFNILFREAVLRNQPLKIYSNTLSILIETNKLSQINGLLGQLLKKYKAHVETWLIAAEIYYRIGLQSSAKDLLEKAHKSLPKPEHMNFDVKFALMCNKYGQQEFAQALMENMLTLYPARIDVWFQYIDMLVKDKLYEFARSVFDRAIIQKLSMRKMKSLLRKYIKFEENYGTPSSVKKVKELAADYVKHLSDSNIIST
ncbi:protein RRP5 homolog [Culicoides brevitarsis]|uniref:protein RRP5 homolog n=1 Tax=Culicoides brevitarsis TaxID=469753 RepID=UPI00307C04A4